MFVSAEIVSSSSILISLHVLLNAGWAGACRGPPFGGGGGRAEGGRPMASSTSSRSRTRFPSERRSWSPDRDDDGPESGPGEQGYLEKVF